MSSPHLQPAVLSADALAKIVALESDLGAPVVAHAAESPYATLDSAQLAALTRVESELGVRLVAYAEGSAR